MLPAVGEKVEGVVVYLDSQTGRARVSSCVGNVACVHYEHETSSIVEGYDLQVLNSVPWVTDDVPVYYMPRNATLRESLLNPLGVVPYIFIPTRHLVRIVGDDVQQPFDGSVMDQLLNRFYRNAPYGWLVLHHQPVDTSTLSEPVDVQGKTMRIKKRGNTIRTRRVVGQVVDFGRDADGVAKLVCYALSTTLQGLDMKLVGGPFHEVQSAHPDVTLFKLAFHDVHDAYDAPALGPPTYVNVLRHLVVDTLQRFRVKTVKYENENKAEAFFYGFTEDGFHFARNGRMALNTEVPTIPRADPTAPGAELRSLFSNHAWLNLCPTRAGQAHNTRRGYVIYGRVITRDAAGQTTLQWCCPPPGMDLLRVYLATQGNSPIFRALNDMEVLAKLKDKNGDDTVASDLFTGLIDPQASNASIDYIKKELMWGLQ